MKLTAVRTRLLYAGAGLAALMLALSPLAAADTFPYLVMHGGDTWTGGAFANGGSCGNSASNPYYYQNSSDNGGGIATYKGNTGSAEDFGAFALGSIFNGAAGGGIPGQGLFTDKASGGSGDELSFANSNGGNPDGSFEGSPQNHCVPDYYGTKQNSPTNLGLASGSTIDVGSLGSKQYLETLGSGGQVNLKGTVAAGKHTTLFVKGDVYITNNITEAAYNESNVPKFALVVKGNIFVDPGVSNIDGWYIAQPDVTSDATYAASGYISTCDDSAHDLSPQGTEIHDNCQNNLTVNGALTAKQVNYLRVLGDVTGNGAADTPAETLNFTAANVLGGPFFNPPANNNLDIQSLVSLPPQF